MRIVRSLGLLVALAVTALVVGTASPAQAAPVTLTKGGSTTITTAPGVAATLLQQGIVAYTTGKGRTTVVTSPALAVSYAFPVSGGTVDLDNFVGTVNHRGGLVLVNVKKLKPLAVTDFVYDLEASTLSARVEGTSTRVALFDIVAGNAETIFNPKNITLRGLELRVSEAGAAAVNSALGTTFFTPGLSFATATTVLNI